MLPTIDLPTHKTKLPSTGEEISFRPFLVKEQKVLLMAMEGQDAKEITDAVKNIVEGCITSKIDINKISTFDLEFLFLKLREKSVGSIVTMNATHGDCKPTLTQIDLSKIKIVGEMEDTKIALTKDIGVKVRYPNVMDLDGVENNVESIFSLICRCVEFAYDGDNVYNEFSKDEIEEWVGNLHKDHFDKISKFFNNIPKLEYDLEFKCKDCGETVKRKLEGLQSFFT